MELFKLKQLRKILIEELKNLEDGKVVLLPYPSYFLKILLFDDNEFDINLSSIYYKIDFSNVDFSGIKVRGTIFDGMIGVKINPQTVYEKDLSHGYYDGVEFIGPFDNVNVEGSSFRGSQGAIINPQKVYMKNMDDTNCADVIIIGSFENVSCDNIRLKGAIIPTISEQDFTPTYKKPKHLDILEDFSQKIKTLIREENLKNK